MKRQYNIEKQHQKGKLHAIERINMLLDNGSFVEVNAGTVDIMSFSDGKDKKDYDAVITGFGTIDGKKVCLYAQDFTIAGGTVGSTHGEKIANIIELAIQIGCPVIGILDSGGARIQESVLAIEAYGRIFRSNTKASGVIPQIAIIAGTCAGGACYSPALQDFIFLIDDLSKMFLTGPKVVKEVMGIETSAEELGGVKVHTQESGVAQFRCNNEKECYNHVKDLIKILPSSVKEKVKIPLSYSPQGSKKRLFKNNIVKIDDILPTDSRRTYDVKKIITYLCDDDSILEVNQEFAPNIVTVFAKISDVLTGIVANNPNYLGGILDTDASDKAAKFIRYCDAYDIPIITLVDTPGFIPGPKEEKKGIIRHGAKMLYAYSEATTIRITVILRKEYGGACLAMGCKSMGIDFVYSWPNTEIAVMGADGAIPIIYKKELAESDNIEDKIKELSDDYREKYVSVKRALEIGFVDDVIEPENTRECIFKTIQFLESKRKNSGEKKHGIIPL